ncbi:MAG TPA: hypothetical protein VFI54_00590 [Solirubrobacteraceae bacterium]|nr:hypothetical protein [Solirubrobacteraceae bacterium]
MANPARGPHMAAWTAVALLGVAAEWTAFGADGPNETFSITAGRPWVSSPGS